MCDACPSYALAGLPVCNICNASITPTVSRQQAKSGRNVSTATKSPKTRQIANNAAKVHLVPLSVTAPKRQTSIESIKRTLAAAGMVTDDEIAEGLKTGRVVQTISWQTNYEHVVDYLLGKGYPVARYKFLIVCGSAAA